MPSPAPEAPVSFQEDAARRAMAKLAQLPKEREQRRTVLAQRFDFFAPSLLRIRTKEGGPLIPLVLNPIQADYLQGLADRYTKDGVDRYRGVRDIIIKPRQLGFSTFIAGLLFMDGFLEPGRVTVVLTHKKDLSMELLRTYSTFCDSLPPALKAAVKVVSDSKYELELEFEVAKDEPPSRFIIATERGEPWRGGVIHNLHASEAAWYRDWGGFKASFVQAVPITGNIFYETTANGFNELHQAVVAGLDGRSADRVVFYAWYQHPEYRLPWDEERQAPPTTEELVAMKAYGLDLEQLAWRRWKQAELGDLFPQEYPETLLGAFLSSGRPVFDPKKVQAAYEASKLLPVPEEPRSNVKVWEPPIPGELYLLCADVAEGINRGTVNPNTPEKGGTDFSAAYVIKVSRLQVVAAIHGRIPAVPYARMVDRLGREYEAVVAVERNNHGHTVLAALEASGYPEVYRHSEYNAAGQKFLVPGFPTNAVTRPQVVDALDEAIRSETFLCPDPGFWMECHTFHRNDRGKPEAMPTCHDDRVIGAGIGVYLCTLGRGAWGVEGVIGADAAGFPRRAVPEDAARPAGPAPIADPAPLRSYQGQVVGEDVLADLMGSRKAARAQTCEACFYFDHGLCKLHRWSVVPADPACEGYVPAEEPDLEAEYEDEEPFAGPEANP